MGGTTTSTAIWVVVAVAVVAAIAAAVYLAQTRARTRRLKRRFGPEYDRTVRSRGGRGAAERELLSRERRHEELELHELDPARREQYREQWVRVQERFVDTPEAAVEQADGLVTVVMGERGYPTHGFEEKVAHLSVEHGRTMGHYRSAHAISDRAANGEASTEDLRQAMQHYRALFEELLSVPAGEARRAADTGPGGDAPSSAGAPERLLDPAESERFRERWREVQSAFVDDPGESVRKADDLASEAVEALGRAAAEHRRTLSDGAGGGEHPDTERLRLALRGYRDLLDRIFAA